jgi:hypothetical protein
MGNFPVHKKTNLSVGFFIVYKANPQSCESRPIGNEQATWAGEAAKRSPKSQDISRFKPNAQKQKKRSLS